MQQHSLETAGPQPPEAVYLSKVADKSAYTVSYSSDIAAGWSTDVKSRKGNGKASVAGSLYLTASDSGSQSGEESVYDAVSLPDSETDLEVEFGAARTPIHPPVILMMTHAGASKKYACYLCPCKRACKQVKTSLSRPF